MRKYPARHRALISVLRSARLAAGLSQVGLSRRLKEVPQYIHMIEAGQRGVQFEEFIEIVIACEADPVALLRKVLRQP